MTHRPPLSTHDSPLTTHQSPLRVAIYYNLPSRLTPADEAASEAGGPPELLGLPYPGAPADAISLLQNKPRTSHLLRGAGLPTPDFVAIDASPGSPAAP